MIHLSRWKVVLLVLSLLFGVFFAYPNVLSPAQREALPGWLPSSGLNLGLDLQGGSYLLLEVDVPAMREKRLGNLGEDARTVLAEARVGVLSISRDPAGVVVTLADPSQMDLALQSMRALIGANTSGVVDRSVQRQGADRIRYVFTEQAMTSMASDAVTQSIEVVRRRLDSGGTKEINPTRQGANRIVIQAPGQSDHPPRRRTHRGAGPGRERSRRAGTRHRPDGPADLPDGRCRELHPGSHGRLHSA